MDLLTAPEDIHRFFGLAQPAFGPVTDPGRLFASRLLAPVLKEILAGRQIVCIKGAPGAGKTSFMHVLAMELRAQQRRAAIVGRKGASPADIQATLAHAAGLPGRSADATTLLRAVWHEAGLKRLVLLCDNAETLPADTLRYLSTLLKLAVVQPIALQLVLIGEAGDWPGLADPALGALRAATASSYTTLSLLPEEAVAYLDHRVRQAGQTLNGIMTHAAAKALALQAHGNAGKLDALAQRALLNSYGTGYRKLNARRVRQALPADGRAPARRVGLPLAAAALAVCLVAAGGLSAWLQTRHSAPAMVVPPAPTRPPPPRARQREIARAVMPKAPAPAALAPEAPAPAAPVSGALAPEALAQAASRPAPQPPAKALTPGPAAAADRHDAQRDESGLVLIAGPHDTMPALYARVYRGLTPPPYAAVLAVNQRPVRPGAMLIFPAPPQGWTAR